VLRLSSKDWTPQLNFFALVHKSIFSGRFYAGIAGMRVGQIVRYVAIATALASCIAGVSRTWYALRPATGIAAEVSALLDGMELKNGTLDPHRPTPFVPGIRHLANLLGLVFAVPQAFDALPDSILVVDTSAGAQQGAGAGIRFLLTSTSFIVNPSAKVPLQQPYRTIINGGNLVIEEKTVRALLEKHIVRVAVFFILWTGIVTAPVFLLSIAFLSFAAYIFRLDRSKNTLYFLKIACFAASPVYVGTALAALSGAAVPWVWHAFILVSMFVMFRGVSAAAKNTDQSRNLE
jgi:hypothetical protein